MDTRRATEKVTCPKLIADYALDRRRCASVRMYVHTYIQVRQLRGIVPYSLELYSHRAMQFCSVFQLCLCV